MWYDKVYFRNRRRCFRLGERHHHGFYRAAAQIARAESDGSKNGPLHQRGPGHNESLSARRGLCDGGRRGNRPRFGALREVYRRKSQQVQQSHDGKGVLERAQQGAQGGISRRNRADYSPHHKRNKTLCAQGGGRKATPTSFLRK